MSGVGDLTYGKSWIRHCLATLEFIKLQHNIVYKYPEKGR